MMRESQTLEERKKVFRDYEPFSMMTKTAKKITASLSMLSFKSKVSTSQPKFDGIFQEKCAKNYKNGFH